jgi:spermidine/putrescine transport system permease protein
MFPLYNSLESLDTNQLEAAKDLGSSTLRTHWRIVIPHAKAGIASGSTMVFMLTCRRLSHTCGAKQSQHFLVHTTDLSMVQHE